MSKIEISGAWVEFQTHAKTETLAGLRDIHLSLGPGDKLGVTGPNGSGKTTLLRLISGIYPPTRGAIVVNGNICSMLGISTGMHGKLSGRENILHRSKLLGRDRALAEKTVEDAMLFGNLADRIDDPLDTYSSGMKMRLAFSIATIAPSEIVIMDEWLSVGDSLFKKRARKRMETIVSSADILILASHNKSLLSSQCNRFLRLSSGRGQIVDSI